MIGKIIFVLVFCVVAIAMFEISYQEIYNLSIDDKQNFTPEIRDSLKWNYNNKYLIYLTIIVGVGVFTFVPLKEIETETEEEEEHKSKPKKQTYYDYVKERLEIERMMSG